MRPLLTSLIAIFLTLPLNAEVKPAPGTQTAQSVEVSDDKGGKTRLHYWLALPPASETKPEGGWPVMFFFHGSGERGNDLAKIKQHGPPKLHGSKAELKKFIIVSPQCPAGRWWDLVALKGLIDHTLATQPGDKDRVVLTGLSIRGDCWQLTLTSLPLPCPSVGQGIPKRQPLSSTCLSNATTAQKTTWCCRQVAMK